MLSALHSALAPEVAPRLDFAHHWNMFLKYYAKQVSDSVVLVNFFSRYSGISRGLVLRHKSLLQHCLKMKSLIMEKTRGKWPLLTCGDIVYNNMVTYGHRDAGCNLSMSKVRGQWKSHFPESHISQKVTIPGNSHFPGSRISREVIFPGKSTSTMMALISIMTQYCNMS